LIWSNLGWWLRSDGVERVLAARWRCEQATRAGLAARGTWSDFGERLVESGYESGPS